MNASKHPAMDRRSRMARHLGGGLVIALALAACGQGEDALAPTTVAPTSTTVSPTTEATPTTVTTTTLPATTSTTVVAGPALALSPDGLTLVEPDTGSTTQFPFGTPQDTLVTALDTVLGSAGVVNPGNVECPNGQTAVAVWSGIQLEFVDGVFLAWFLQPGSTLTDMTGVGLGSPLSELTASWDITTVESTLGTEFSTAEAGAGLGGLLSDSSENAVVTNLWAGPICAFR